jgi:DNA invertase Pin-like site-specific DNA recombinase
MTDTPEFKTMPDDDDWWADPSSAQQRRQVLGYIRVSTETQAVTGHGLEAQRDAITAACRHRGWQLDETLADEGVSSRTTRPALERALEAMDRHEHDVLMISKLDRISRSMAEGALIIQRALRNHWELVVLDLSIDMTTPQGRLIAGVILAAAEYERDMLSQRTREGLAAARRRGVQLGRPRTVADDAIQIIRELQSDGMSLNGIAAELMRRGVPAAHGGTNWYASSVRDVARRYLTKGAS